MDQVLILNREVIATHSVHKCGDFNPIFAVRLQRLFQFLKNDLIVRNLDDIEDTITFPDTLLSFFQIDTNVGFPFGRLFFVLPPDSKPSLTYATQVELCRLRLGLRLRATGRQEHCGHGHGKSARKHCEPHRPMTLTKASRPEQYPLGQKPRPRLWIRVMKCSLCDTIVSTVWQSLTA